MPRIKNTPVNELRGSALSQTPEIGMPKDAPDQALVAGALIHSRITGTPSMVRQAPGHGVPSNHPALQ